MSENNPPGLELLYEGAAAYQGGDIAEALRIFEHAVATTADGVRTSALINAASMYDELGDHEGAAARYRRALAEIPDDATEKRASTLINYSQALQHLGALDDAQSVLEQARDLLTDAEDLGVLRVSCLLSLSAVATHRSQWSRVIEIATESLDAALLFAPHLCGHPLMNLAGAYFETGRRDLGVDFAQQALAAFTAAGDHNAVADTQQNLAQIFSRLDRLDEAEELVLASQAYYEGAGLGYRAGIGWKIRGFLAECRGDRSGRRVVSAQPRLFPGFRRRIGYRCRAMSTRHLGVRLRPGRCGAATARRRVRRVRRARSRPPVRAARLLACRAGGDGDR